MRKVGNKSLEDYLRINDDFSLWWMSIIVEQHISKSPILDILKIFALSDIILETKPTYIEYYGNSLKLQKTLKKYSSENNVNSNFIHNFKLNSLLPFKFTLLYQLKSIIYFILYIYKKICIN